ncbi:transposable element tcb2 transposase [Trichonephila clavipes]|nr:transposable element tcb2 transposase [Trichonephila clavipes]
MRHVQLEGYGTPDTSIDTTLSGDRYISILSDHLHPFMSIVYSDGLGEFQQNNTTPHTPRITTGWLQEPYSEFRHFRWLPKSPDMNIAEYIWDALQRTIQKRSPPPLTPTNLWTALQDSWSQLPPAILQILIESMPRCVAVLLRARGSPTRY